MEPLYDFRGRTLPVGTGLTANAIVDGLLRLHAGKHHAKPVTIYVVGGNDPAPISAVEAMMIAEVMRTVRSPLRTAGFGLLTGWLPLILACGTVGQRYLLPHTLVSLSPPDWIHGLQKTVIGLHRSANEPAQQQTERLLQQQHQELLAELKLPAKTFATHRILSASAAIEAGIADHVVERKLTLETSIIRSLEPNKNNTHENHI